MRKGVRESTKLQSLYGRKMEVPEGRGSIYKFPPWWGMDIFWNCTIILLNGWGDDLGGFCVAVSDNYDNFW